VVDTRFLRDAEQCAEAIVEHVGRDVRLALPIGIGKPILLLNALYRLAESDRSIKLTIFTGLTLARPQFRTLLEKRFAGPLLDRLLGSNPEPLYVAAMRTDNLPPNIAVKEFFLQAGAWLTNGHVQRNYISLNYKHVAKQLEREGANVFAQLVAPHPSGEGRVSLSSNTDVALDMMPYIEARRASGQPVVVAAEINANLPYMRGSAELESHHFDLVLDPDGDYYDLFAAPKEPVSLTDYAMALHAASLIKDGGTLQIGIGSFSDALTHALVLRHTNNDAFLSLLERLGGPGHPDEKPGPFAIGLYGCTEMLVDGFLKLKEVGVLRRRVSTPEGKRALIHAGFFVGNRTLYNALRNMPAAELDEICMMGISFTNTLDGETARKHADRVHARFVNTAMKASLLGAVSSDALEDGRVVSGVGGQLDLISQAHELKDARAIIALRSTHRHKRRTSSNLLWSYANTTVPRSLRDLIVTEYGIADIRARSDRDTIVAMLSIADTHFQPALIAQAQRAGKLEQGFRLPASARDNHPDRIKAALEPARRAGLLPQFPLGSDMDEVEQLLLKPLLALKTASYGELLRTVAAGLSGAGDRPSETLALQRLGLAAPTDLSEHAWRMLVRGALRRQR